MQSYWFLILISLAAGAILKSLLLTLSSAAKGRLPPGPASYPVIGNLIWLKRSVSETETVLRNLHSKIGLTVSLRFGPRLAVFVADRKLAHQALIHNGAVFADRPPPAPLSRITLSNQQNISSSFYGPTWRLLRRNLTSEILHPSRVKCYSHARKWVLHVIKARLVESGQTKRPVQVMEQFQYAMFCLLVFMCFGDKLDEKQILEIERVQLQLLLNNESFGVFSFFPGLAKMVLRKRWSEFLRLRKEQEEVLIPLIRARGNLKKERATKINEDEDDDYVLAYADTLFDLELPDEKRKLTETEMMGLCSEFLIAGADTTATALQWIMANLVKNPQIQNKLLEEIKTLIGDRDKIGEGEIVEEELSKLPYLKGVVLEGLRRHPPAHFVLPHAVTEESKLGEYVMPKKGTVNFMVAEMGRDPKVWEDPMSFKPERFVGETAAAFDIKGIKEIKMMPFGAGRRICPGYGLALLHLEYFVANLVWSFEWKAVEGDEVDLSEKQEFTVVMKNPLQANVSPRFGVH